MREGIRTLIVDDEPLAREGLRLLLSKDGDIDIVGECRNGKEALRALRQQDVDLLFLDVQMPGLNGFDVIASLPPSSIPAVIFVTAHDRYALKALKVHAVDYLLKPYTDDDLREALLHAKENIRLKRLAPVTEQILALARGSDAVAQGEFLTRLPVASGPGFRFIQTGDVDWFGAADDYVEAHAGGKTHLLRETIAELERKLDPARFIRIHRSTIVNIDRIREIRPFFSGDSVVLLTDGSELRLSRSRKPAVTRILRLP